MTFRPRLAIVVAAVGLVASLAPNAGSQPAGTIKIVVPYTPGSGPDILSRLMAEQIGRAQGPTVVVENRPGGGTVIGTEAVERAEPDGHTVLLVANSFVANPALKRASYDPTRSFEPVCYLAATPMVLVVLASSPYRTLNDLIAAARAKPGELAFASGGPGSSLHVAIEVLKRAANINVTYVPYGGTAPAINALMGNHVAAVWADYPTVVSQLSSGALRGLVTTSRTRLEALPEVPTLTETGISNYEADIFYGIVAPAKTPPEMVNRLSAWLIGALKASDMKPKLAQQGLFPVGICGAEFGAYLQRMVDDYTRIIREANITVK
ncbi:MAG: Bug family tripartite tricarboxylate transporter substrate binding protein [Xanthobacteraceae bacterium]|jgi:tripartite-type tricarboxylate transporter receptor subunit TctC